MTELSNRKYNKRAIFIPPRHDTSAAFKTTWTIIERIRFPFMIQETTHQMMHYQAMQGESLSSPSNILHVKHSANVLKHTL